MVQRYLLEKNGCRQEFVCPAHRIDQNTRGPVIFAKNRDAANLVQKAFKEGRVFKTYQALLAGRLSLNLFIQADIFKNSHKKSHVKNLLVKDRDCPLKDEWIAARDNQSVTISATMIKPLQIFETVTFCQIEIWTGRYHQIRAVCEAVGFPVCGDRKYKYNPDRDFYKRNSGIYANHQMLICKTLEIPELKLSVTSGFNLELPDNPAG